MKQMFVCCLRVLILGAIIVQKSFALEPNLAEPSPLVAADCVLYQHAKQPLGLQWNVSAPKSIPVVERFGNEWNDTISAAWIRNGYYLEAYVDVHYVGLIPLRKQYCTRNGCWYDFPGRWNDKVSSFKCLQGEQEYFTPNGGEPPPDTGFSMVANMQPPLKDGSVWYMYVCPRDAFYCKGTMGKVTNPLSYSYWQIQILRNPMSDPYEDCKDSKKFIPLGPGESTDHFSGNTLQNFVLVFCVKALDDKYLNRKVPTQWILRGELLENK